MECRPKFSPQLSGELTKEVGMEMPTVKLSNGLVVGNFSSPHQFDFVDGSVLTSCTADRVATASLKIEETVIKSNNVWTDVGMKFITTDAYLGLVTHAIALWKAGIVDIVLIPFTMTKLVAGLDVSPFRVICLADRNSKKAHIDKFCLPESV
jgi:hypothetical protein